MDYKDLFRVGGSVSKIHQLRRRLDHGEKVNLELEQVPTVASLLKLFFQQLPDAIVPEYQRRNLVQSFRGNLEPAWPWQKKFFLNRQFNYSNHFESPPQTSSLS